MNKRSLLILVAVGCLLAGASSRAAEGKKILFLSSSEAFAHGPIVQRDGNPSVADEALSKLAKEVAAEFTSTKDASSINAENLKNYNLVIFYTQGDLTKPNKDGAPPMSGSGEAELIQWIQQGGGFMGFHSATDSFRSEGEGATPYITMLGAEFRGHGAQFEGTVQVVDAEHPTMAGVPDGWKILEEWYMFHKFNTKTMHVLALLEPGPEGRKQESYNIAPYPIIWASELGKGRVYYNAIGHREDLWSNPTFEKMVMNAIRWTMGEGEARTEPNFDTVVPKEAPTPAGGAEQPAKQ